MADASDMETKSQTQRGQRSVPPRTARTRRPAPPLIVRPSPWLEPGPLGIELSREVRRDLHQLQRATRSPRTPLVAARLLVEQLLQRLTSNRRPDTADVNRRLRAARLWINAVLAGDVCDRTCSLLTEAWLPQLAGLEEEPERAAREIGRTAVEFLRGTLTASIFPRPWPSLVPHARALHALEQVLSRHLAAIQQMAGAPLAAGRPLPTR